MSLVSIGAPIAIPDKASQTCSFSPSSYTLNTAGYKCAQVTYAPKSGTISKVGVTVGSVTTSRQLKVSIQGVNASGIPDGTIKGGGNAYTTFTPTAAGWYSGNLVSPLTVSAGDPISVVVEFSGDTGNLTIRYDALVVATHDVYSANYTTSWTKVTGGALLCGIEYDDGSQGVCPFFKPFLTCNYLGINNGSATTEIGIRFKLPAPVRAVGASHIGYNALNGAFQYKLYDVASGDVLATAIYTAGQNTGLSTSYGFLPFSSPVSLSKDTWYRLVVVPTTSTIVGMNYFDVDSASLMDAFSLGQNCYATTKTSGSWVDTTTRRYLAYLLIDQIDDGSGGGGGGAGGVSRARVQGGM